MTEKHWSRRNLLQYGSVGIALAIAGCGDDTETTDDGSNDGAENEQDTDGNGETDADGDETEGFELAGDGAAPYREWLVPEHTIDRDVDADTKQLYQFNDFDLAVEQGWTAQSQLRQQYADSFGLEGSAIESEVLVGPVEDGVPWRLFFGSFDTETVAETLEERGVEQTATDGEFTVFGGQFAVSDSAIVTHPEYDVFLETSRGNREPIGEVDEDVATLLNLVPQGAMVTLARRENSDLSVEGMSVVDFDEEGQRSRAIRTLVFDDADAVGSERIREIVVENSVFEEILTEETDGRVAMVEVGR